MKKAFLKFMGYVGDVDCPFYTFNVSTYKTYIEVAFTIATAVKPSDLGWLNTHLEGGRWFVVGERDTVKLIVRFDKTDDE